MRLTPRDLLTSLLISLTAFTSAQEIIPTLGKEFWFGFMQNYAGGSNQHLYVYVSSETGTFGTMSSPLTGWTQDFTVAANSVTQLEVPLSNIHTGSEQIDTRSVLIETADTVAVYALNLESATADAAVIYPTRSLGTDYRVHAYQGIGGLASELLIVATADGTEVEITPACTTVGGEPAGVPFLVQLDQGESYQIQAAISGEDVTGTRVRGTDQSGNCRPFAVFSGAVCTNIPTGCAACDHIFEQNLPIPFWGLRYYTVPWFGSTGYTYRILSAQDGTSITVDNGAPIVLNAGQFTEVNGTPDAHCIVGNVPFSVAQYMQGNDCSGGVSDPALLILNPEEQKIDDITFSTVVSPNITDQYINVLVDASDASTVFLDGTPVASGDFQPIVSCPDKVYARLSLSQGSHRVSCVNGFTGYVYGFGQSTYETYAYSVGSFSAVPVQAFDSTFCIVDTTAFITLGTNDQVFEPYWSTLSNPTDTLWQEVVYTFQPTASDVYVLTGASTTSDCIVEYFFSVELVEPPTSSVAPLASVCAYTPLQIDLNVVPAGTYNYSWTPTSGLVDPTVEDPVVIPVHDGWYHVDISTLGGCSSAEDSVFVDVSDGDVLGVQATSQPAVVCDGGQAQLGVDVLQIIGRDDFNNGTSTLWDQIQGGAPSNLCGAVEGDALRFNDAGARSARTVPLDMSAGGTVRFSLKIANGVAPCDDVDDGENILVEYSVNNGGSWLIMATYVHTQYPDFGTIVLPVPAAAETPATLFRWRQLLNSGVDQDNWLLDDVAIGANSTTGINFTWTPSATLSNGSIVDPISTPVVSQMYTVSLVDSQTGCTYADSVEVTVAPDFALDLTGDTAVCGQNQQVQIQADPVDLGQYTWQWTPNDGSLSATNVQAPFASPDVTTTYQVTVTNQVGCTVTASVLVTVAEALSATTFAAPDSICQGASTQLQVQAFEGSGSYSFSWTQPATLDTATSSTPIATPQQTVTYQATVTDLQCGISVTVPLLVTVVPAPPIELGDDQNLCPGASTVLSPGVAGGYLWSTGATTAAITVDEAGTYWVQAINSTCVSTDTVDIIAAPSPGELGNTVFGCVGRPSILGIPYANGTYLWEGGETTQSISVTEVGDYPFLLTDIYGCSYVDTVRYIFDPLTTGLVVPNVISPNGDGKNDRFEPQSGGNPAVAVSIFNRFGQEVFSAGNLNQLWSGRKDGNTLPEGTYYYVVRYTATCTNQDQEQKGAVTLVR